MSSIAALSSIGIFASTAAALSLLTAAICYRQADSHHQTAAVGFLTAAVAGALWVGGYGLQLSWGPIYGLWILIPVVTGAIFFAFGWIIFIIAYSGHEAALTNRTVVLLGSIPLALLLIAMTHPLHGLFVTETTIEPIGGVDALVVIYGPAYALFAAYIITVSTVSLGLLGRSLRGSSGVYLQQTAILMIATILPLIGICISLLQFTVVSVNALPFIVSGSILLVLFGTVRYALFDVRPIARDEVIDRMRDGVIVLNSDQRVVEVNSAAQDGLELPDAVVGEHAMQYRPLRAIIKEIEKRPNNTSNQPQSDGGQFAETIATETGHVTDEQSKASSEGEESEDSYHVSITERQNLPIAEEFRTDPHASHQIELSITRSSGEVHFYLVTVQAVRMTAARDGKLLVFRDITTLKKTEAQFRSLIEHTSDIILVADQDGNLRYSSPTLAKQLGYTPQEWLGKNIFELVHKDDTEKAIQQFHRVVTTGESLRSQYRIKDTDDSWRIYECVALNHLETPEIGGIIISAREVTENYRYQRRLQVMNRVLRHDLRNDMNVVLGHADFLLDSDGSREYHAQVIKRKAKALVELGEKVRRIDQELTSKPVRTRTNLSVIVTEEVTEICETYPHATVRTQIENDCVVLGDSSIGVAVRNLLENAIEHNTAERPIVTVTLQQEVGSVRLSIEDNGPGIPQGEQRVVESGTETPLEHISGLGLWLVVWIIENVEAEISFGVGSDGGTTICCTFTTVDADCDRTDNSAHRTTQY